MSRVRSVISGAGVLAVVSILLVTASLCNAGALWTSNGVELRGAGVPSSAIDPQVTTDGSGGAIVTWQDNRSGTDYIYARRISASGSVQWSGNGVELRGSGVGGDAKHPQITSDGHGGAIVTWQDTRAGLVGIYAQRVSESGAVQWAVDGIVVRGTGGLNNAFWPQIAPDGSGGALITWYDFRNGQQDIFAQKISASGVPQWTANGVELRGTGVAGAAYEQQITSDGSGGAIVTWQDYRDGKFCIYVQRALSGGTVDSSWPVNGRQVRGPGVSGSAGYPQITTDGAHGAIVTWQDNRADSCVYAQRVDQFGAVRWTVNGIALRSGLPENAMNPQIASDGSGGAIVAWEDSRSEVRLEIYAQRLNASGAARWIGNGVRLGEGAPVGQNPQIASDGSGGALVTWQDYNGGQVYAQMINASGAALWASDGAVLRSSAVSENASEPQVTSDGSGGAVVAWQDNRSGSWGIYAQRFAAEPMTLTTGDADTVTGSGASLNGKITGTGGEKAFRRGFRYRKADTATWTGWTVTGSFGTGSYSHAVEGLEAGTGYEYQAMAHNSAGWAYGSARSFTTTSPTWYLAEGTTAWGFSTYITVQNPNAGTVTADLTYMPTGKANKTEAVTLSPNSQTTLTNDHLVSVMGGASDFSTKVTCREGKTIAVDRTMTWTGPGAASEEAHNSVGVTSPAKVWYLPEGSSAWGFECWLLIQNPNNTEATCTVTYMIEGEGPREFTKTVPANSRATYNMADDIGARDASIKVVSGLPVIPERAMYRNNRREGHDSIGTTAPATNYYLAEGATGYNVGYISYVLVQNPQSTPTDVSLTYQTQAGEVAGPTFQMPANSRKTIRVNDQLSPNTDVSTQVHGNQPIIAERAMYWNNGTGEACHDSIGMSSPHTTFYLPDGETSNGRETWTLVQNPNGSAVDVEITYMTPDGQGNVTKTESIPASSRKTFNMAEHSGITGRAAIKVRSRTAGKKIMVERAMYWNNRGAGTDTIGGYSD